MTKIRRIFAVLFLLCLCASFWSISVSASRTPEDVSLPLTAWTVYSDKTTEIKYWKNYVYVHTGSTTGALNITSTTKNPIFFPGETYSIDVSIGWWTGKEAYRTTGATLTYNNGSTLNIDYTFLGSDRGPNLPTEGYTYYNYQYNFTVPNDAYANIRLDIVFHSDLASSTSWTNFVIGTPKILLYSDDIAVIDAVNKSKDEIIANQDKNAQDIMDNQDKNTDQIINDGILGGADPNNAPGFTPPTSGDYDALQGSLDSSLDSALKDAAFFSFDILPLVSAFGGLNKAFTAILDAFGADFKVVFKVSLIAGVIALLVGLVINVSKNSHSTARSEAKAAERKGK